MVEVERSTARFIPFRKKDIIDMCLDDKRLSPKDAVQFRRLCEVLISVFHFEYHAMLEQLKDLYAPVNPDRDTRRLQAESESDVSQFATTLEALLNVANYERLNQQAIEAAFEEASLFKIKLRVDFDAFDEVLLFTRGEGEHTQQISSAFGFIKKDITFTNFDRVVLYIKYRDDVAPEMESGEQSGQHKGATLLKLFQNVPKADLEMLFPSTRIAMRNIDKVFIGIPAIAGAVAIATTKAGASLLVLVTLIGFWLGLHADEVRLDQASLVAILAALGGIGSYIWKQLSNFRNRKLLFMQSLTQNLYFKNLDNNAGVFYRLIDDAEEEESKEALLAYYFLLTAGPTSSSELDGRIEAWFDNQFDVVLDFDVSDAVAKLQRLGLASDNNGTLEVLPLQEACQQLDARWDNYFDFRHQNQQEENL